MIQGELRWNTFDPALFLHLVNQPFGGSTLGNLFQKQKNFHDSYQIRYIANSLIS